MCVFDPENWDGSSAALILSTHKSARHDWETVQENPALQDCLRSDRMRATAQ